MKKEYLKPTARSHELRCNRIMNASQSGEQGKISNGNLGSDSWDDNSSSGGYFYTPIEVE